MASQQFDPYEQHGMSNAWAASGTQDLGGVSGMMGVSSIHSAAPTSASSVHSGTSSPGNSGQFAAHGAASSAATSSEMSALQSLSMSYARKLDIAVRAGAEDDTVLLLCEPLLNPNIKVRPVESKRVAIGLAFFSFFSSSDFSLFSLSRDERTWTGSRCCTSP
jgi:hypothetical protein